MSKRLLDQIEIPADLRALPREDVGRVYRVAMLDGANARCQTRLAPRLSLL